MVCSHRYYGQVSTNFIGNVINGNIQVLSLEDILFPAQTMRVSWALLGVDVESAAYCSKVEAEYSFYYHFSLVER